MIVELHSEDGTISIEHIDGNIVVSEEFYGSPYGKKEVESIPYADFIRTLDDIEVVTIKEKETECMIKI